MGALKLNQRLRDIIGTARTVVSQLDLDKALSIVLKKSMEVTKTKAGSIALYNAEAGTLQVHAHRGFSKSFLAAREWKISPDGLTAKVLKSRKLTVIGNTARARAFTNRLAEAEGIKALVCAPLVHRGETVGVLYVDDFIPRKFSTRNLEELEVLASFASIAIHHARTHRFIKQQAITDSLTGLFNRRCFEDILSREIQRAERHGREFAVALVDVDDFKKYNDHYGHQAGDEALAALGAAIRKSIRSTDLAARYGGDEMVIILPETRLAKAYSLFSRRIKSAIEAEFRSLSEGRHALSVTIGISSFPGDGASARELVLAADRALLSAKKNKQSGMIGCSRPAAALALTP